MSLEIILDVAGEDSKVLHAVEREVPEAQVEHLSGMGGLDLIGTIAIPSVTLALQIFSMLRERGPKESNVIITQVHIYEGDQSVTINVADPTQLEQEINEAVAGLG